MKRLALLAFLLGSSGLGQAQSLKTPRYDVPPKRYALDSAALDADLKEFQGDAMLLTRTLSPALEQSLKTLLVGKRIKLQVFLSSKTTPEALSSAKGLKALGAKVYRIKSDFGRGRLVYGKNIAVGGPVDGRGDGQMFVSEAVAQTMRLQLEKQLPLVSTLL